MIATTGRARCGGAVLACVLLATGWGCAPARQPASRLAELPKEGDTFIPADVNRAHPVYESSFDAPAALKDWRLEGGKSMSVQGGRLVLESQDQDVKDHLVCWLAKEAPADFLLEFTVRPQDRRRGLNIVFFSARGLKGESIFDPSLQPRTGPYVQYYRGDINCYHVSYWAAGREVANMRKSPGFYLVGKGKDLIYDGPADAFQTVRIYKRGGSMRVMVDDVVALAYDDDGKTGGPAYTHPGWIGLRQMSHTRRCEYGHVKVYPLAP